jgi:hypothetical protein
LNVFKTQNFSTQKKQRLELFFKMEAANQLKRQEANRKETMEIANSKALETLNSPSYDAELSAATASIISLPVETSPSLITTHNDVSLVANQRRQTFLIAFIISSRNHLQALSCISSMRFFPSPIKATTCAEQLVKFSMVYGETSKFKSCTLTNSSLIRY